MRKLVGRCFSGAAVIILTAAPAVPRAMPLPLNELAAQSQVIARVRFSNILPTRPPGHLRHTARATVITAVKGATDGSSLTIDFDTGVKCPNVLYAAGEDCLVFLRRRKGGHLETVDTYYGKLLVREGKVESWPVARFQHRTVPLDRALGELRRLPHR